MVIVACPADAIPRAATHCHQEEEASFNSRTKLSHSQRLAQDLDLRTRQEQTLRHLERSMVAHISALYLKHMGIGSI